MLQVYLRESPRSIFLLDSENSGNGYGKSGGTALLLTTASHASGSSSTTSSHRAIVEAIPASNIPPLNTLQKLHNRAYGCLGLINVGSGEKAAWGFTKFENTGVLICPRPLLRLVCSNSNCGQHCGLYSTWRASHANQRSFVLLSQ